MVKVETPTLLVDTPEYNAVLSDPSCWLSDLNLYVPSATPVVPIPIIFDFNFNPVEPLFS